MKQLFKSDYNINEKKFLLAKIPNYLYDTNILKEKQKVYLYNSKYNMLLFLAKITYNFKV